MTLGEIRVGSRQRGDEGVVVYRPSILGNPWHVSDQCSRIDAIELFEETLEVAVLSGSMMGRAAKQLALRVANGEDLVLVCCCDGKACHAEVIREVVFRLAQALQKEAT